MHEGHYSPAVLACVLRMCGLSTSTLSYYTRFTSLSRFCCAGLATGTTLLYKTTTVCQKSISGRVVDWGIPIERNNRSLQVSYNGHDYWRNFLPCESASLNVSTGVQQTVLEEVIAMK